MGTWKPIVGETNKILTIPGVLGADDGRRFRCVATNAGGEVTSNEARIILPFPTFQGKRLVQSRIDAIDNFGSNGAICITRHPNGGFVYRSDTPGKWVQIGRVADGVFTRIKNGSSGLVYAVDADSKFYKSTDSGETWNLITTLSSATAIGVWARCYALHVTADGTVLVADMSDAGGHVFRSTDDGETFTDLGAKATGGIYKFSERNGVILCPDTDGKIYSSTNDGLTWTLSATLATSPIWSLCPVGNGQTWCCANELGNVYRSTDDGTNWTLVQTVTGGADAMAATDDFIAFSTYTGDRSLYVSLDAGLTWNVRPSIASNYDDILGDMIVVDNHIVSSTDQGWIFYTNPSVPLGLPTGAWTPASINTQAWFDASDASTLYESIESSAGVANGLTVGFWTDKSGKNRHLVQGTEGSRPTVQGSGSKYAVLRFLNNVLWTGENDIWRNISKGSVYVVRRVNGYTMAPGYLVDIRDNAGSGVRLLVLANTTTNRSESGGRRTDAGGYRAVTGVKTLSNLELNSHAFVMDFATTEATQYINGEVDAALTDFQSNGTTDDTTSASFAIGAHKDLFTPWIGEIAEVIITHDTDNREKIEGYLHHKWGIEYLLPDAHPYKTSPPMA